MKIQWRRSTGDFVESHCGQWFPTPIYGGFTKIVGSGSTQHECKALSQGLPLALHSERGA